MKLITHNDRFHADDVFATATLQILFGDKITDIIRTRDETIFPTADIIYDVGGEYSAEENKFDHHQAGYEEARDNGIPYSSFGLIWKKWGEEICGSEEAARIVDRRLIQPIDAYDNGFSTHEAKDEDYSFYSLDKMIASFGPTWREDDDFDSRFFEAVEFVTFIIQREIKNAVDLISAQPILEAVYKNSKNKEILVLDDYMPFGDFFKHNPEIIFVVSPKKDKKDWRVLTVSEEGFKNKKDFPQTWAGFRDTELQEITGVKDALFCHRGLFLAVAKTKEGALKLAEIALDA